MSAAIRTLFLFSCVWAASAMGGESWPAFHNGGNASVEARDLPMRWSPGEGIGWSVELPGYGQSAPVVWKDRVYVTAVEGDPKIRLHVVALDAKTGEKGWARELTATVPTENGNTVSRADAAGGRRRVVRALRERRSLRFDARRRVAVADGPVQ
jgi:outer membrane protein assembly factor BamB